MWSAEMKPFVRGKSNIDKSINPRPHISHDNDNTQYFLNYLNHSY